MYGQDKTGLEFIEGFALLATVMWVLGALLLVGVAMMGAGRV